METLGKTGEVRALKEEVTTLKGQLEAQCEQMSMIVRALQMSGLQIPMPTPDLSPPLTSQPLRPRTCVAQRHFAQHRLLLRHTNLAFIALALWLAHDEGFVGLIFR
ncbi:hypothetical protein DVH24_008105 [Malus domestica]|uniref:Uncharacterized protein n=1 Tax=Malus domestica TaxID=3750 RepID=A0A498JKQ8_MALDO|nr:hypothetical protein DVH24_008105 [Malus domestica]